MDTLRAVFGVPGAMTLTGAFVLAMFPSVIPSATGITVTRPEYLLVYLVAAAELAVAVLSFGAIGLTDWPALRLVVTTLVALHLVSGVLDVGYKWHADRQFVLRFTVVAVLLGVWWAARRHHTPGTSR